MNARNFINLDYIYLAFILMGFFYACKKTKRKEYEKQQNRIGY